ncbi:MAG: hypothetical protein ACRC0S_08295 [Fusobacteriaceae bacterium]
MKNKMLANILVYIISPIVVFSFVDTTIIKYFIIGLGFFIVFYTMMSKKREGKINLTGIVFSIVYISFFSFKQSVQPGFYMYVINTYFFIIFTISIGILNVLEKSGAKQVYIDCLKAKGWSDLNIWNLLKKSNVSYYLKKMESIVTVHLLTIIFIRVYSIATYGIQNYKITTDLEILTCVLFVIVEVYILSKIVSQPKQEHNGQKNNNINDKILSKRVINLNQYKNMNK